MPDLYHADRDALIRLVREQREALARQEARLAQQERELAALRAANAQLARRVGELAQRVRELEGRPRDQPPGPAGAPPPPDTLAKPKQPRKKRRHNVARRRMAPTARVVHAVERCPDCGVGLAGGGVRHTREVIELAPTPVTVTEHVYLERRCPRCRKRWAPRVELAGVVLGRQRLGVNLLSLVAALREEGRLPLRTIRWYLATVHGLHLSVGGLVGALRRVAAHGAALVAGIRQQIRGSPVVNVDETGWRQDGTNGSVWAFCTPAARYFVRRGRNKEVIDEVLGERFDGVLVSDFYAAYDHYPGAQQRCWWHLPADVRDLQAQHPDDAPLAGWAAGLHDLYERAVAAAQGTAAPAERRRAKRAFEQEARALCQPYRAAPGAPQRTLCQRVERYLPALFEFVLDPRIPATNNAAERALRHLVTSRKISGGTRSAEGSDTKMALATLFGTWRAEGRNPFTACREMLTAL